MVEFETLFIQEKKYGRNNFIEVARKRSEQGFEFISVARGWFAPDGRKRYKRAFSLPINKDVLEFTADVLTKLSEGALTDEEIKAKAEERRAQEQEAPVEAQAPPAEGEAPKTE